MIAVNEAVVDLHGEAQLLFAVYIAVFPPRYTGNGVIAAAVMLIGQGAYMQRGRAGEI